MGKREVRNELLTQDIILLAIKGNEKAVYKVIQYYQKKIHNTFIYTAQKKGINISYMPLADMEQEAMIHLILAVKKFKL